MAREARRLRDLVRKLLDAQRMEGGRLIGERVESDIALPAVEICEGDYARISVTDHGISMPATARPAIDEGFPADA